jgi:hypothetical protein
MRSDPKSIEVTARGQVPRQTTQPARRSGPLREQIDRVFPDMPLRQRDALWAGGYQDRAAGALATDGEHLRCPRLGWRGLELVRAALPYVRPGLYRRCPTCLGAAW